MNGDWKKMKRTEIAKLYAQQTALCAGEVTVAGWIRTSRESKNLGFIELNDGSCFRNLQVIAQQGKLDNFKDVMAAGVGSALIVRGQLVLTPDQKQPFEVNADSVEIEGAWLGTAIEACPLAAREK